MKKKKSIKEKIGGFIKREIVKPEPIKISKAEKRLILPLSRNEFTVKELSFIFNRDISTIRSHLHSLRHKGLIIDRTNQNLVCPSTDKYYSITEKARKLLSEEKD